MSRGKRDLSKANLPELERVIREALRLRKISAAQITKQCNMNRSQLHNLFQGRSLSREKAELLITAVGLPKAKTLALAGYEVAEESPGDTFSAMGGALDALVKAGVQPEHFEALKLDPFFAQIIAKIIGALHQLFVPKM